MAWGSELIIDMRAGEKLLVTNKDFIDAFSKKLVERINMTSFGEPQTVYFGEDDKKGFTLVQLITTSNITGHFCDETGDGYLNIFSCKSIDVRGAIEAVFEAFHPDEIHYILLDRQAGQPTKVVNAGHARQVIQIEPNTVEVVPTLLTETPQTLADLKRVVDAGTYAAANVSA